MNVRLLRVLMAQLVRTGWMTTNVNVFQALTDVTVKSVSDVFCGLVTDSFRMFAWMNTSR